MIRDPSIPRWLETLMVLEEKALGIWRSPRRVRLERLLMKTQNDDTYQIADGPCFDHSPNKIRRVRVQGRAGPGRFLSCIDVDTGEKLCMHVSKFPAGTLPDSLTEPASILQKLAS